MKVAIGLGASLGDRRRTLERTVARLAVRPGFSLLAVSRWYRSPPMRGGTANGWFLNGVALFDVALTPWEVLDACRALEDDAGRRRARYWGDRPLDLDVLLAEGWSSDHPALTVPHPGIAQRPFVAIPLREAWPDAPAPAWPRSQHPGIVAVGASLRPTPRVPSARP